MKKKEKPSQPSTLNPQLSTLNPQPAQGGRIRKIYEDCVFCHHEISQLSSRESRESRKRRVALPALVGFAADANERRLRRLPVYRHQGVLLAALSTGW